MTCITASPVDDCKARVQISTLWLRLSHMRASSVAVPVVDTTGQQTPRVDGQGMPRDSSEADRRDYDQIKLTIRARLDPPWILLRRNQDGAAARRASRGKALVLPPTGPREERLA